MISCRARVYAIKTNVRFLIWLLFLSASCFAQNGTNKKYLINPHGIVNLCGKEFTYTKGSVDTFEMEDPQTEASVTKVIKTNGYPIKMDGKKIYDESPVFNVSVEHHLYSRMKKEFSVLEDGYYNLGVYNIIVDDNGTTCAFSYEGVTGHKNEKEEPGTEVKISKQTAQTIFDKVCNELANFPAYLPAEVDGKKVVSVSNPIYPKEFKIQSHKVFLKVSGTWKELRP